MVLANGKDMTECCLNKLDEYAVSVTRDGAVGGLLHAYIHRPGNDSYFYPLRCRVVSVLSNDDGARVEWQCEDEGVSVLLDLKVREAGYSGVLRSSGRGHAIIRLVWELPEGERGFPFVPAFMYGWNEGGGSPYATHPQLSKGEKCGHARPWVADEWLMRTDRSSHGLTSVITDSLVRAIGGRDVCRYADGSVAEKTGLGISSTDPHRLTFSLGFGNAPYTHSVYPGRNYCSRPEAYVNLDRGDVAADFFIFIFENDDRQSGAARLLRESYALLHDAVGEAGEVEEAVRAIGDALVRYGYSPEARDFLVCFHEEDGKAVSSNFAVSQMVLLAGFPSAWAGGLRTAYPLLLAGHELGNDLWLRHARDAIDNIVENGMSEKSGLFFENHDLVKKEWSARGFWYEAIENPGHSGYVNGQICHYLLLAYLTEDKAGIHRPEWLAAAKRVLDHVAAAQGDEGGFGYTYSEEDGSLLDGDGFSGCWFTPAFATLYRITERKKYLDVARRAMDFYRRDVEAFHVYGGPLDIHKGPDGEGILAWIEAARTLHELTGEEQFLGDLVKGLDYEFSWKFAYNVVNEVEPLKSKDWCSTGGSVTSVNNSHIHPLGSQISNSILYAAEVTGDPYIWSRLVDTVRWTLTTYLHHDGDYGWGKRGMICERYCYTDSLLVERFPDGSPASTWFCAQSWASGAVLEGLTGKILDDSRNDRNCTEQGDK